MASAGSWVSYIPDIAPFQKGRHVSAKSYSFFRWIYTAGQRIQGNGVRGKNQLYYSKNHFRPSLPIWKCRSAATVSKGIDGTADANRGRQIPSWPLEFHTKKIEIIFRQDRYRLQFRNRSFILKLTRLFLYPSIVWWGFSFNVQACIQVPVVTNATERTFPCSYSEISYSLMLVSALPIKLAWWEEWIYFYDCAAVLLCFAGQHGVKL